MHNVAYIVLRAESSTEALKRVTDTLDSFVKNPLSPIDYYTIEAIKEKYGDVVDLVTDKRYGMPSEENLVKMYKEILDDETLLQNAFDYFINETHLKRFANIGKLLLLNMNSKMRNVIEVLKNSEYAINLENISSYLIGLQSTNLHELDYDIWEGNYLPYQFHLSMSLTQLDENNYERVLPSETENSILKTFFVVIDVHT